MWGLTVLGISWPDNTDLINLHLDVQRHMIIAFNLFVYFVPVAFDMI